MHAPTPVDPADAPVRAFCSGFVVFKAGFQPYTLTFESDAALNSSFVGEKLRIAIGVLGVGDSPFIDDVR
jgi:hypothetical protein